MRTIEKQPVSISDIQTLLNENVNKQVCVVLKNKQGKKIKEFVGSVVNTYASHFVLRIKINNNFINKSFAYVDFLTNELSLEII